MSKSNNGEKTDMFTKKYDNNKDLFVWKQSVEAYMSENAPKEGKYLHS